MTTQARQAASRRRECLVAGWQLCGTAPGRISEPSQLSELPQSFWIGAASLGPVADVLRSHGSWSLDGPARRFDAEDWWYRAEFETSATEAGEELWLGFDGLATVADVWLNGQPLLHSTNMFTAHEIDVSDRLKRGMNSLVLRFHSLDALLKAKQPRPRWRAPMVANQQLRWFRTTLLGRTPGWSPPAAVVGPWKDIWLERRGTRYVTSPSLHATVGADGTGQVEARCLATNPSAIERIELEVERDGDVHRVVLQPGANASFTGTLSIPNVSLWWPHTHGEPALYRAHFKVHLKHEREPHIAELRTLGFRTLRLDTEGGRFSLQINGIPVFCRGACWTPLDPATLRATPEATHAAIEQARDAGMNMLRVGGTMVYEDAHFFNICDKLGVLVWQDFMFANMDYPETDEFVAGVRIEAMQQLAAWQTRPSLAVLCGNSEVEQQAAMWGAPRELWSPRLFHSTLREWAAEVVPGVPYWPSSAHGGAFPHQGNVGSTSYYGVGAYLRAPEDARRSEVKFATECLAFANVPDDKTLARMPGGLSLRAHHAAWKERTPRDLSAGWDFEDVRDHYLASQFKVLPSTLRSLDHDRYLALSRVTTGEMMAGAFSEWRRPGSSCGGALVWFLRDLWAGAGWGLFDDAGRPKACLRVLSRALQPVSVFVTDEGGNGLFAHVVNEREMPLQATLEVSLYGERDTIVGQAEHKLDVPARGNVSTSLAEGLDGFLDVSYAYRFGPPPVTLVHVALRSNDDSVLSEAFQLPAGFPCAQRVDVGLSAQLNESLGELTVSTQGFAQHLHIDLDGFALSDNDFHLAPGSRRVIAARRADLTRTSAARGEVKALNSDRSADIEVAA